jgi:uncharacterized protein (DUF983 family)
MTAGGGNPPTPVETATRGLCPRCGAPTLFVGPAFLAERCRSCGLDFDRLMTGNAAAALVTLAVGVAIALVAVALQWVFSPPLWVQLVIWIPVTAIGVSTAVRFAKARLLAQRYLASLPGTAGGEP